MKSLRIAALVLGLVAGAASAVGPVPAAHAQSRVTVANDRGAAVIDPTYATTLKLTGAGFQSISGGHGGIYVFFGTVTGNWRPSKGGVTGKDYLYIPDSESQGNAGHQRYVAFPGSDTSGSANGGTVSAAGRWSTTITVPGARFQAVDRDGQARAVDCEKVTCGIITVGAHGVSNAANESFTPVKVADLYDGAAPTVTSGAASATGDTGSPAATDDKSDKSDKSGKAGKAGKSPGPKAAPVLTVDRASAVAGRVLSFTARGLPPGGHVSAVLDDGLAAAGPFLVGVQGQVTGVVTLPQDAGSGTHELRLFGLDGDDVPVVRFAISPGEGMTEVVDTTAAEPASSTSDRLGLWFFAAAGLVLLGALARLLLVARRRGAPGAA